MISTHIAKYLWCLAGIGLGLGVSAVIEHFRFNPETITSLNSPDDSVRAVLRERSLGIDRRFDVLLRDVGGPSAVIVYTSPDEGRPIGSERFIWSHDGSHVLLVGRHFVAERRLTNKNDEVAYLLIRVHDRRLWCNAAQRSDLARFSSEMLKEIGFPDTFDEIKLSQAPPQLLGGGPRVYQGGGSRGGPGCSSTWA